jgi:hypothetical protein
MRAHPLSSLRFYLFNSISVHLWYTTLHNLVEPSLLIVSSEILLLSNYDAVPVGSLSNVMLLKI